MPAFTTGERSLHVITLGQESTRGTGVTPTAILPGNSTGIETLDRAYASPNEDYGMFAMSQPGRANYGVRLATFPFSGVARYEDLYQLLKSSIEGGVSPVHAAAYTRTYTRDTTADTLISQTIQEGDNLTAYQMVYGLSTQLKLSFNALAAPGNSPWTVESTYLGLDRVAGAFTGTPAAPASMETIMGHLTVASLGTTATAFGSLTALPGLLAFELTVPTGVTPRKYGGTTDTFDTVGRAKTQPTFTATWFETAGTISGPLGTYMGAGTVVGEVRMRVQATGSLITGSTYKQLTIDQRIRYTAIPIAEDNGATVYQATGDAVYDGTLGSDLVIALLNNVATDL